jgi:Protein of unknown function (DUF3047)
MRHRLIAVALVGLLAGVASAAGEVVVEDWKSHPLGVVGIPAGWKAQSWGSPKYDLFSIVDNDGHRVLRLKSQDDGSTISKDIKGKVNLKDTPILEWSWRMAVLPKGGNACSKATDDEAGQVYVAWPRFPEAVRSQIIGYIWDTTLPVGTICKSEKTGTVTYVVLRSGATDLGKWVTERRNVVEDFKQIYGHSPDDPAALSLAIDSNDTHSSAESFIGPIVFRTP